MSTFNGIDVSTFQGSIDWPRVKAAKIEFAMIRASYGWKNPEQQVDVRFHENAQGAAAAGIPCGAYHYSYATTVEEAHLEAAYFLRVIDGYKFAYPVAIDIEDRVQMDLGSEQVSAIAQTWCDDLRAAGYYPMIYINLDWIRNRMTAETLANNEIWLAQYNDRPTYMGDFGMWQYTNSGKVDGIAAKVDCNIAYKDYAAIIQELGLNGFGEGSLPVTNPQPNPQPVDKTVTVKSGDTLSDIAARYKLSWQALYDYDGNKEVIGANPNLIRPGMVLRIPSGTPATGSLRVGANVTYTGRLYGDSYGGSPGLTVNGTYTVTRIINGRKAGVQLGELGWVPASEVRVVQ